MAASYHLPLPKFTLVGSHHPRGTADRAFARSVRRCPPAGKCIPRRSLATIVSRSAKILGIETNQEGALEIASRSRGTPRIANRLLKRVRDFRPGDERRRNHL